MATIVSREETWAIADRFADEVHALVANDLVAAVVVGSLAAGHYVPGRSDIDIIIVVRDTCPDELIAEITRLADQYWKQYGFRKGFGGYAVRRRDLRPPWGLLHDEVYEILQLKRQGRVIWGQLDLSAIPEPTQGDIRRSLADLVPDLVGAWERSYPAPIDPADARTNTILYWLRLFVWDRTGEYVLDKCGTLDAFAGLSEGVPLFMRLGAVSAYVKQERSDPRTVDVVCHEVETFVLATVEWARVAAGSSAA
jgi:predicted nucleotidyltransferase